MERINMLTVYIFSVIIAFAGSGCEREEIIDPNPGQQDTHQDGGEGLQCEGDDLFYPVTATGEELSSFIATSALLKKGDDAITLYKTYLYDLYGQRHKVFFSRNNGEGGMATMREDVRDGTERHAQVVFTHTETRVIYSTSRETLRGISNYQKPVHVAQDVPVNMNDKKYYFVEISLTVVSGWRPLDEGTTESQCYYRMLETR